MMKDIVNDLSLAMRRIRRAPGLPLFVVMMLALSIGSVSALFSLVRGLILAPLPYPAAEQLVLVWNNNTRAGLAHDGNSLRNLADYRTRSASVEGLAAFATQRMAFETDGEAVIVQGAYVSSHFFPVMGLAPELGRTFVPAEDVLGAGHVVVLSHRFWIRQLGGAQDVVGRTIELNKRPVQVIGIMPPELGFPRNTDVWINLPMGYRGPDPYEQRNWTEFFAVARMRSGATLTSVDRELNAVAVALEREYPDINSGYRASVVPLRSHLLGESRAMLWLSLGTATLVLLIACANIASLLVAQGVSRQRDVAIRLALGAEQWHIIRALLVESVLLSMTGGLIGLSLAGAVLRAFVVADPFHIDGLAAIRIDGGVMAITVVVSLATGIAFGLLPARQATKPILTQALKDAGHSITSTRQAYRTREALLVAQVALAVVLLAGAGLTVQSFRHLQQVKPGFRAQNVVTLKLSLLTATYGNSELAVAFHQRLLASLSALPGVTSAGTSGHFFADFVPTTLVEVEGRVTTAKEGPLEVGMDIVSPEFFRTLGIAVRSGRAFTAYDHLQAPKVVMVNDAMAKRFWPGANAVGKRIRAVGMSDEFVTVVGVVADYNHLEGVDAIVGPELYFPLSQNYLLDAQVFVATSLTATALTAPVRRTVRAMDPGIPVQEVRSLAALMDARLASRFAASLLLSVLGLVALTLALSGIYGTWSHQVAIRAKEIAIRMALGAPRGNIHRMIVRRGGALVIVGLAVGWILEFAVASVVSASLPGVAGQNVSTLIGISLLLLVTALVACYVPARRATRGLLTEILRSP